MKRKLTAAVIAAAAFTAIPQAHADIRLNGGKVLISKGDPASKLNRYMGRPLYGEMGWVCKRPSNSACTRESDRNRGWGRILQYSAEGRDWTVEVYDGIITRVEWN